MAIDNLTINVNKTLLDALHAIDANRMRFAVVTDDSGRMLFQYKRAKSPKNIGRIFSLDIQPDQTWLPDQIELSY